MPIVFRNKGKHNSTLRRLLLIATAISSLVAMPLSLPETVKAQEPCAPTRYCLFAGCYYVLLNNTEFDGTTCRPDWVFPYGEVYSRLCSESNNVVLPATHSFYQDFSVPNELGNLKISLEMVVTGAPTSNDRLLLEVYGSGVSQAPIEVYLNQGPFQCTRKNYTFTGNYANRNLRLEVRSEISTPGVQCHINWVQLFYSRL